MNKKELLDGLVNLNKMKCINYSFSQEGEDMIIDRLLNYQEKGFYIDIGALHPFRFSNTMHFYERGWNGINIDATPGSMKLFEKYRKRDINLEMGISNNKGKLIHYEFNEPALNTFDSRLAQEYETKSEGKYRIIKKVEVETLPVMDVLDKYVPVDQKIDLLDIDIEGLDECVIQSIDWKKYRPHIIIVEKPQKCKTYEILENNNYSIEAMTLGNLIYMRNGYEKL